MENIYSLDGNALYTMLRTAFTSLSYNENYLNDINTFPVSDSDTGTNMKQTFKKGLASTDGHESAGKTLFTFARNMSLDSRGNSGFILSQYFIGLGDYLKDKDMVTLEDFKAAIVHAYKVAYAAVVNPVEGTMLTVMREGAIQSIQEINKLSGTISFGQFLNSLSHYTFDSVLLTHSQMGLLEHNNVVDSGALGFYLVIDGMRKAFDNSLPYFDCQQSDLLPKKYTDADNPLTFFRYCTEFTIKLNDVKTKDYYLKKMEGRGDSTVVAINGGLLKVHIHTSTPQPIIKEFKKYGQLIFTKIDDLYETPQFARLKRRKYDDFAVIAFTSGDKTATLFESLGCDAAFPVPADHKYSEEEIRNLLEPYLSGNVIAYSQNKKIEEILKNMHWWGHMDNLLVVESNGRANAFFKLASSMFNGSFNEFKERMELLKKIQANEFTFENDENLREQLEHSLSKNRLKGLATIVAFGGKNITDNDIEILNDYFSEMDDIEFTYFPGGQEEPLIIIGAM